MFNVAEKIPNYTRQPLDDEWEKWCDGKKFAFLSPYQCPFGQWREDIVNGCTGFPTLFGGADFYWYPDLKDLEDFTFLNNYTHIFINVYPEYFELLLKIREKCPDIKIIGIGDIQTHVMAWWSIEDLKKFTTALRAYDVIFCTNVDEVQTWQGCVENPETCQYTGWPMYNELTHYNNIVKPEDKDANLMCLGINNPGDFNRDILTNLAVFRKAKQRFPDLKAFMYYMTPNKREDTEALIKMHNIEDYELVDELPYDKAIEYLSKSYLACHMYTFKVVGRLAQDCASLGVPLVGTIANFPNRYCFPETSVNDYYVNDAVDKITDLLTNPYFYNRVRSYALETSQIWGINETRQRVLPLLKYV